MIYTADVPLGADGPQSGIVIRDDRGVATVQLPLNGPVGNAEEAESLLRDAGWPPTAGGTATDQGWAFPVAPAQG